MAFLLEWLSSENHVSYKKAPRKFRSAFKILNLKYEFSIDRLKK
jgi:hypothetical protein